MNVVEYVPVVRLETLKDRMTDLFVSAVMFPKVAFALSIVTPSVPLVRVIVMFSFPFVKLRDEKLRNTPLKFSPLLLRIMRL